MVNYTPHYLLQMGGTLGASGEIWSCGIRMFSEEFTGFDEQGWFDGVGKSAPAAWMGRATSMIHNTCALTFVKFNYINAAGHYDDPATTRVHFYPTPVLGASSGQALPYQCSVVLSWRTDAATRGRASKGRIYSPSPTVETAGTTGLFSAASAQGMATSAALLLNTLDAGFGGTGTIRPHIMSAVDGSYNEINSVIVDNRVDIQRRRAEKVVSVPSAAPVLY